MNRLFNHRKSLIKSLELRQIRRVSDDNGREQLLRLMEKKNQNNIYQEYITNNRYCQEIKEEIEKRYRVEEEKEEVREEEKRMLGDNYILFNKARHVMRVEGLNGNEEEVLEMKREEGKEMKRVEYVVKGKIGRHSSKEDRSDRRGVRLQKVKEMDYLDHQYSQNKAMFNNTYQSMDDHFSRFISSEDYEVNLKENQVAVLQLKDNTTMASLYEECNELGIGLEDIDVLYDILNRPAIAILTVESVNQSVRLLREQGHQTVSLLNDDQLASVAKTVMIRNIDVTKNIQQLASEMSIYGKIMRMELAQVVADVNLPNQEQVQEYLEKSPVDISLSNPVLQGTGLFNQESLVIQQHNQSEEVEQKGDEHIDKYIKEKTQDYNQMSMAYMNKHFKQNIFPFKFNDAQKEYSSEEVKRMEQCLRREKSLNNLGYVMMELSSVEEAKGCLLGLCLEQPHLIASLQEDNSHLHADPFYLYNKLKRVNAAIDQQKMNDLPQGQHQEQISIEGIFTQAMIDYQGSPLLRQDQTKVIEAYLEEKQFSDNRHFTSALQEYLDDQPTVGRQKLDISPVDYNRRQDAMAKMIDGQHQSLLDNINQEQQEQEEKVDVYSLVKDEYDQHLYEMVKGEYSDELLKSLFVEQQGQSPKKSMYDFVKDIKCNGEVFIKEGEVNRLIRQNYRNSKIGQVQVQSEQEVVDSLLWKERIATSMPDHKAAGMDDFFRAFKTQLIANEDNIGIPQEYFRVPNEKTMEEVEEMIQELKEKRSDNSTDYELMSNGEDKLIVKMVRDVSRVDLEAVMKVDTNQMMTDIQNTLDQQDSGLRVEDIDVSQLFSQVDVSSIDQDTLQELAQQTNISINDVIALLAGQVDNNHIQQYLQKEQAIHSTRTLHHTDLVQNIEAPNIKDTDNTFRKTKRESLSFVESMESNDLLSNRRTIQMPDHVMLYIMESVLGVNSRMLDDLFMRRDYSSDRIYDMTESMFILVGDKLVLRDMLAVGDSVCLRSSHFRRDQGYRFYDVVFNQLDWHWVGYDRNSWGSVGQVVWLVVLVDWVHHYVGRLIVIEWRGYRHIRVELFLLLR